MGHRGDPLSLILGCCLCLHLVGTRNRDTVWVQAKQPLPHKGPEANQVFLHTENVSFKILQEVCSCGVLSSPLGLLLAGESLEQASKIPCVVAENVLLSVDGHFSCPRQSDLKET